MPFRDPRLVPQFLGFAAVLLLLGLGHEWVNPWLEFDRGAIAGGQWWRLLSSHLVHLNQWHMLMNSAGLLLCGYFFADLLDRRRFWMWLLGSSLLVGLALYWRDDGLLYYAGLSGILHGLLVLCLLLGWRGHPFLHSLVLIIIAGRLLYEQLPDYDVGYLQDWIGGAVHVNAHLYGALSGIVVFFGIGGAEHIRARRAGRADIN